MDKNVIETEANRDCQYLYKILSLQNWQATKNRIAVALPPEDNLFIHFSTDEQLDRIIAKYWSTVRRLVVLKIDRSKLPGKLVYEANEGGKTKYFHLYDGCIPVRSIVESKVIFRHSTDAFEVNQLEIIQMGDPVLRKPARKLSTEEILSPETQALVEKMKATMRAAQGVGLAAPQVGESIQLAVIEDVNHTHLTTQQLEERDRRSVPFHVIINPRIFIEKDVERVSFFESCLSMTSYVGMVPRAKSVRVECLNEYAKPIVIEAKGWYARILQHEIDHLNGTLYIDRVILPTLMTEENYAKLWMGKSMEEVKKNLHF